MKTNCPWIWPCELSTEEYVPAVPCKAAIQAFLATNNPNGNFHQIVHNHPLAASREEANTIPNMRSLSDEQRKQAELLREAGQGPSEIYRFLVMKCRQNDCDVTFSQKDINNLFRSDGTDALDCSDLLRYLHEQREKDSSRYFDYKNGRDGTLVQLLVGRKPRVRCFSTIRNMVPIAMA